MNSVTTANQNPAAYKTFLEPVALKNARSEVPKIFGAYANEMQLNVAMMIDSSLCVSVDDAVNLEPSITSINIEKVMSQFAEKYQFGSTIAHQLISMLSLTNKKLLEETEISFAMVPAEQKDLIPLYISNNCNDDSYNQIGSVCQNVSFENALMCLVFHYGIRVEHAKGLFKYFNNI